MREVLDRFEFDNTISKLDEAGLLIQVLTFLDADLEKLYEFACHLRRLLTIEREELPREIQ